MPPRFALLSLILAAAPLASLAAEKPEDPGFWPRWRGPDGTGHYAHHLPVKWTSDDVAWRIDLPGRGQSSPVIWGDRLFLTAATDDGRERLVICVDRAKGKILWKQVAATVTSPEPLHKMNTWASATCATDGQRVVAFFGRGGLHCYDMDGKKLWSRELGVFEGPWGTAASPIILGDLVIQNCDADDAAYLLAVNKNTGKTVWKTDREKIRGWSTPILIDTGKRKELVMNGHYGSKAYDPATGKELWFNKGGSGRGTPTVAPFRDMLIVVNGRPGPMYAVRVGGQGAVNATHEVWRVERRNGRDLPSPIVVDKHLIVVNMPGIASCYDAATGKELWRARLGEDAAASPIAAGGHVYLPGLRGTVFVIKPGDKPNIVAKNPLPTKDGEIFRASLAAAEGKLYVRSDTALYCLERG